MKYPTEKKPWTTKADFDKAPTAFYLGHDGKLYRKIPVDVPAPAQLCDCCEWFEVDYGTGTSADAMVSESRRLVSMLVDPAELVEAITDCLLAIQTFRRKVVLGDYERNAAFDRFTNIIETHLPKMKT